MNARPAELPRRVAATLCTLALATELGATSAPPARAAGGPAVTVPVLMYHRIDAKVPADAVGRDLTVEPRAFEAQVRYLHEHRIATLTAADLAARVARGERVGHAVVLTFDDGYEDAATVATPILAKYGERGTFFVSAGFVGTPRHVSWREMRAMAAAGMENACHGTFHLDLSTLDRAGQTGEIAHCVATLTKYLGRRPVSYAYAAGKYDFATFGVLRDARVKLAFTEHPGVVRSLAVPYELPRRRVHHDGTLATFASLVVP